MPFAKTQTGSATGLFPCRRGYRTALADQLPALPASEFLDVGDPGPWRVCRPGWLDTAADCGQDVAGRVGADVSSFRDRRADRRGVVAFVEERIHDGSA